jgi:DNA-binding NtrC family response regulator/tetratricopeptide (TPR) repeat protein
VPPLDRLIGESRGIAALREQIARLLARPLEGARRLPPILLLGETGTGKGLVAEAIHRAGPRADGPFVDLNCAAIPDTLLEAELFGYERGAFTDARQGKPGLLQIAHGGTLFLDEVGLLPDALQAKILKAIEEHAVRRLGSTRREVVDVWVIAATSEDLAAAIRARRFREDLYHRLAVVTLRLPPLRERGDDVLLLAQHFLAEACADYGLPPRPLTPDARAALMAHPWHGNVRELANAMERIALLTDVSAVTAEALGLARPAPDSGPVDGLAERRAIAQAEAEIEREHLLEALRTERWNLTRAADRLGIPRNTLRYRMEKHGLLAGRAARTQAPVLPTPAAAVSVSVTRVDPPALEGDLRRLVFLQARLEPSAASPESRRLMESLIHKLRGFGGALGELTPISVLAIFGIEPLEDAPRRAALAALAVRQLVARSQEKGRGPAAMLGLHTERRWLGLAAQPSESEAEAAAPARAVAAALCAGAAPGEILVSAPAALLLGRRFDLAPVESAPPESGTTYRLIGPAPADRELARFLGRHTELALLLDRFERAAEGRGQAVQLIGDPGIGKSRLLRELRRRLAGRAIWNEAQADPVGRARAFGPLIDLVRRAAGIDDADPEAVAQAALERHVLRVSAELRVDLPWLCDMLGLGPGEAAAALEPASRRQHIFEANRRLLLHAAARRPQVVVVEDVHWADPASLEFLARLAENAAGHRILLLVTSRPGADFHLSDRTHHTRLSLEALTAQESLEMARVLLGARELAPEIGMLVAERAEGNPFFVEELVRSLLDIGAVRRDGDRAVVAAPATLGTVPATVQDMIHARIARLDAGSRALLELVAVVGTEATLAVLRTASATSDTVMREGLERLQAAELLTERALPEPALAFKHALTREVAYTFLEPERRRILHARVAHAVECVYGERAGEQVERLAHHAFHGNLWDRAVGYLRQAGVRATARSDYGQAVAFLEQALLALERLPEGPECTRQAIDVRFELRNALLPLGEVRRALEHLREAERLAEASGDIRRLGWALISMTNCLVMVGGLGEAHRGGERAAQLADAFADPAMTIVSRTELGVVHQERGESERAIVLFREALGRLRPDQELERFGMPTPAAIYLRSLLAANLAERGDFGEAVAAGEEAARMAEKAGLAFGLAAAWVRLGEVYLVPGDAERAAAVIEPALTLLRERQLPLWVPRAAAALGWSRVLAGRTQEGVVLLEQARERGAALPYLFRYSRCLVWCGHAALRAGELDRAARLAEEALEQSRRRGEQGYELEARHLAAEVAGRADGPATDKVARELAEMAERAAALGFRPLVAHCRMSAGELCARRGDHGRAREHLAAAGALYQALGMRLYAARAERLAMDA